MASNISNGMMDYDEMVDTLHGLDEQTDVAALKQIIARVSVQEGQAL